MIKTLFLCEVYEKTVELLYMGRQTLRTSFGKRSSNIQQDRCSKCAGYVKGVEKFKGVSHILNSFLLSR